MLGLFGVIVCAALPTLAASVNDATTHTFTFVAPNARTVNLAGTFNGWKTDSTPMIREGDRWTRTLKVPYGKLAYKFVVNGSEWRTDPNGKTEKDASGNENSILLILPPDYNVPARRADGIVAESALKHDTEVPSLNWDRVNLTLSLRVRPNDLKRIQVLVGKRKTDLQEIGEDELFATYRASIPWNRKQPVAYKFLLDDGKRIHTYGDFKVSPKTFRPFVTPGWVEKSVIYQIFPDRFENGDPSNDPKDVVTWDAKPTYGNFFGGDVKGIEKRLPYLKSLGVGAVYYNPIFRSPSNHRYDAEDFRSVDPRIGTNAEFAALTKRLRGQGIRTILDFAYNHTAPAFFAFDDILRNQEKSRYKDWYFVHRYPIKVEMPPNYEGWWGYSGMPKLNAKNPAVRDYLLDTTRYWVKDFGIDGMRLDVPNEVDSSLWRAMRPMVKGFNKDLWIVGEIWEDGTPWLKGDQFDSVMNYPFRTACLRFVAEGSEGPSQFAKRLMSTYASYVPQVSRNLMNLLSSHDTERFLTLAGGNRDLAKLAATIQFTWVGTPSVYYGEELGMEGGKDPDNRRAMRWDLATPANDMLSHYKKLIALRQSLPALQSGEPKILLTDDKTKTLAYCRNTAIILINRDERGHTITLNLGESTLPPLRSSLLIDSISGRQCRVAGGQVSFSLGPLQAAVLHPADRSALHSARKGPVPSIPLSFRRS